MKILRDAVGLMAVLGALALGAAMTPIAAQQTAERLSDCNKPLPEPVTVITLRPSPRAVTSTQDGCWVFTGLIRAQDTPPVGGVGVLRRTGDTYEEVRFVPLPANPDHPFGLALTHDQQVLVVSHSQQVTFFDVEKLTTGQDALLGQVRGPRVGYSFGVAITPDDGYAFVAQGQLGSVLVIDLKKGRASGFDESALKGVIPVTFQPTVPVLSPDGKYFFAASKIPDEVISPSLTCTDGKEPEGAIHIIDAQKATSDAKLATIGFASPAGCSPTVVSISPDGARLSVASGTLLRSPSPTGDAALVVFDVRPVHDGKSPTLIGRVPLERTPGSLVDTGGRILVGTVGAGASITVVDPAQAASGKGAIVGSIPSPALFGPPINDGRTVVAVQPRGALVIIDLERVSLRPTGTPVSTGRRGEPPRDCNRPLTDPIGVFRLPTAARAVRPTRDGCWIFAGLVRRPNGQGEGGIGVLRRTGDTYKNVHFVPLPSNPDQRFGLALTHDQKVLVASHLEQVTFFDVEKLTSGQDALLGQIRRPGTSYAGVAITPGDQYAFVAQSQDQLASVLVIDLKKGRASGFDESVLVAAIPIASRPLVLDLSLDGRYLLPASKQPPDEISPKLTCLDGKQPEGAVYIIDAQKAMSDAKNATIRFASPAGCDATTVSLSPDGTRLSVVAGDFPNPATPLAGHALVVFDVSPVRDGKNPTLIGKVPMDGQRTVMDIGNRIIVGGGPNSNLTVVDPAKVASGKGAVMGSIPVTAVGGSLLDDGHTLVAFQPTGGFVIVDLDRVQLK